MLTSYTVKCPHLDCDWFGSLLPHENIDSWVGAVPAVQIAVFQCPQCHGEFRGRVNGEDIRMLPLGSLEEAAV